MFKYYLIVGCMIALGYMSYFLIYIVMEDDAVYSFKDIVMMFVVIPVFILLLYPTLLTILTYTIITILKITQQ